MTQLLDSRASSAPNHVHNVLMIHYNFPPLGGIASVRAAKIARLLPSLGWNPLLVAPRGAPYHEDRSLTALEGQVIRTASLEWTHTGKRALGTAARDDGASRTNQWLRTFVHQTLYFPDAQIGWYPFAVRAGRRWLREQRVDALFSSSPPITAHLVARRLHLDSGIPWIAEFRDLWTDWCWNGAWRLPIEQRLERAILRDAEAIVTVSPTYASVFAERGARTVRTLTNGFDPEDFPGDDLPIDDVITYVGTYYPQTQDLSGALEAFGALKRSGGLRGFRLRIVGDFPPELSALVRRFGLSDEVEATGFVAHPQSIAYIRRSKVLLLAGPTASDTVALRGNVAGKTFEYLASGRPILYEGDTAADVAAMLRPFRQARLVPVRDMEGAKAALLALAERSPAGNGGDLEPYTHGALSRGLAQSLAEVAS